MKNLFRRSWAGRGGGCAALIAMLCLGPAGQSASPLVAAEPGGSPNADDIRMHSPSGMLVELNPGRAWADLVIGAKAAEEGDADLASAARDYATIVRIFEQLRSVAAEALHRQALLEARRKNDAESKHAWERLARWFPDFDDKAAAAARALGTAKGANAGPGGMGPTSTPARVMMSPELMRRYGLTPSPATAPSEPEGIAPDAGAPPGFEARYGAAAGVTTGSARTVDKHATERALLSRERTEVLAEAAKAASEFRRSRTELSRVAGASVKDLLPTFVSDPRLRQLIEAANDPSPAGPSPDGVARHPEALHARAQEYFEGTYLPRLKRTTEAWEKEAQELRQLLADIDARLSRMGDAP